MATETWTSQRKIALFREMFRGREDVYPKRWTSSAKGISGYSPACANEWRHGVCHKPQVRCSSCPARTYLPVTDRVVLDHLQGRHSIGVYPMLADDTCWFLAADFDDQGWQEDVAAFVETCRLMEVPLAVERSRSGEGAHVWFFFAAPVAASAARAMGCFLLTETMARRHGLSLRSYDRLFPNQDRVPQGGFGNLIALPLEREARLRGNSTFVDSEWHAMEDPWQRLAEQTRLDPDRVHALAREGARTGRLIAARGPVPADGANGTPPPWEALLSGKSAQATTPLVLPREVRVLVRQQVFIAKAELPPAALAALRRLATFHNPEFYRRQRLRFSTARTPRVICCAEDHPEHVALPRACLAPVTELLAAHGSRTVVDDRRELGAPVDVHFRGRLLPWQQAAVDAVLAHEEGVLVAAPGSGKTVIGAFLVAARARATLVLVHRAQLVDQWIAQLAAFLGLCEQQVGRIAGGRRHVTGTLDVATYQSLVTRDGVDDMVAGYGHVLVDECHHVPAPSYERVLRAVRARYVTGLTATPQRRDGLEPIREMQLGPVRYALPKRQLIALQPFVHQLVVRRTLFATRGGGERPIQELYGELATDDERNRLIVRDVAAALDEGRRPLVLTERRDHLARLVGLLLAVTSNVVVLRGGMSRCDRAAALAELLRLGSGEDRVLVATGRYVGEGFDDALLDTLFLALPISWRGTLVQYAGRLHRAHYGKRVVQIYDYVDEGVPKLTRMFARRQRGYRAMGYRCDEQTDGERSAHAHQPEDAQLLLPMAVQARRRDVDEPLLGRSPNEHERSVETTDNVPPSDPLPDEELDAMIDDVTITAFTREDQAEAFLEVLSDRLELPFTAELRGAPVRIDCLRMAKGARIVVHGTRLSGQRHRVRLESLQLATEPIGWEWAQAYVRWAQRG